LTDADCAVLAAVLAAGVTAAARVKRQKMGKEDGNKAMVNGGQGGSSMLYVMMRGVTIYDELLFVVQFQSLRLVRNGRGSGQVDWGNGTETDSSHGLSG